MNWEVIIKWFPRLLEGAALTLELVAISVVAGLLLAIPLGIARSSTALVRTRPALRLHFLLPWHPAAGAGCFWSTTAWRSSMPSVRGRCGHICATRSGGAVITMTLHTAAYIAEILRGAIQAIPPGEIEAARAMGMSKWQTLFYIVMPRATRIGLPAYSNEVILMLKASALASTITLLDLTGMARTIIARTYLPVEIFFAAGMLYLLIAYILVRAFKLLERKLRVDASQQGR